MLRHLILTSVFLGSILGSSATAQGAQVRFTLMRTGCVAGAPLLNAASNTIDWVAYDPFRPSGLYENGVCLLHLSPSPSPPVRLLFSWLPCTLDVAPDLLLLIPWGTGGFAGYLGTVSAPVRGVDFHAQGVVVAMPASPYSGPPYTSSTATWRIEVR